MERRKRGDFMVGSSRGISEGDKRIFEAFQDSQSQIKIKEKKWFHFGGRRVTITDSKGVQIECSLKRLTI